MPNDGITAPKEEYVLTPGGYRPKSKVYLVDSASIIQRRAGRVRTLKRSGEVLMDHGVFAQGAPGTPLMPANVSHLAPTAPGPEKPPGFGSGWITFGSWNSTETTPVSSFVTTWQVPANPATQSGQQRPTGEADQTQPYPRRLCGERGSKRSNAKSSPLSPSFSCCTSEADLALMSLHQFIQPAPFRN